MRQKNKLYIYKMEQKSISFSFSKTSNRKKLTTENANKESDVDKESLISIEEKKLKGTKPKEVKKKLVIPLLNKNNWRISENASSHANNENGSKSNSEDTLNAQAADEILRDLQEAKDGEKSERVVPLLVQNAIPQGYETDTKLDVSLRPRESVEADYDQVPIEEFGMALLRGMGLKDEEVKDTKIKDRHENVARPKGLGLGANTKQMQQIDYKVSVNKDGKEDPTVTLCKGAYCVVVSGRNKDLYAQIESIDLDNSRVIAKMELSGEKVNLSQFAIKLVTTEEFKKYSKYLNKGKSDRYKEKQTNEQSGEHSNHSGRGKSSKKHKHYNNRGSRSPERRKRSRSKDRSRSPSKERQYSKYKKSHHKSSKNQERSDKSKQTVNKLWIQPHLKVRIIDENYKKGTYFKVKVIVEDIASVDCVMCKTQDGKVLDDLQQDQLETVIPRLDPSYVMVLSGQHKTKVAEVLKKDKEEMEATVQLLSDRDTVFVISYDQICEYTGDVSMQLDF